MDNSNIFCIFAKNKIKMEYSKLIDELLNELSYRVGIVDLKNKTHQSVISEILTEWGEYEAKSIILD